MSEKLEFIMETDKTTKGAVRYADAVPAGEKYSAHSYYLKNAEAAKLGNPRVIKVTIEKME